MRKLSDFGWLMLTLLVVVIVTSRRPATAQTLRGLNETLDQIEPGAAQAVGNPDAASEAIDRLDQAEADFARVVEEGREGRVDQEELLVTYHLLERMLDQIY